MSVQHRGLSGGRWAELSFPEQMANIGSEVRRALHWKAKGNAGYSLRAASRALELLDLSLACTRGYPKLKELSRAREALVDLFFGSNLHGTSESVWRRYFDPFNFAARK